MIVKLLTKHHSSQSTLVKMSTCWKSHAAAHYCHPLEDGNYKQEGPWAMGRSPEND